MTYGEPVLLTAPACHMCDHARATLAQLGIDWREVDEGTPAGALLAATAPPLRPVLFGADGAVLAYGRLSARRLRRELGRGGLPAGAASPKRRTQFTASSSLGSKLSPDGTESNGSEVSHEATAGQHHTG